MSSDTAAFQMMDEQPQPTGDDDNITPDDDNVIAEVGDISAAPRSSSSDADAGGYRPGCWSEEETNALLDAWAERDIQESLALAPHEQACVYERVRDRLAAALPGSRRSPQDCRLRVRKLKTMYAKSRKAAAQARAQGAARLTRSPYYERLDKVLGGAATPRGAGGARGGRGAPESAFEDLDEFDMDLSKVGIERIHDGAHIDYSSTEEIGGFLQDPKLGAPLWKPWDVRETSALLDVWLAPDTQAALAGEPRGAPGVYGRVRNALAAALPGCRRTPHECRARVKKLKMMYAKARRGGATGGGAAHGADRFTYSQLYDKMDRVLGSGTAQGGSEAGATDDTEDDDPMAGEGFPDSPWHRAAPPRQPRSASAAAAAAPAPSWSVSETNALLDVWAERDIQAMLASSATRTTYPCVYEVVRDRLAAAAAAAAAAPGPERSAQDCRLRIKKLKTVYTKSRKGAGAAAGAARPSKSPYYERLDRVLGRGAAREANGTVAGVARDDNGAGPADAAKAAGLSAPPASAAPEPPPPQQRRRGVKRHGSPGADSPPGRPAPWPAGVPARGPAGSAVEELVSSFLRLEERRERRERELEARLTRLYTQWEERRRREDRALLAELAAMQARMQDEIGGGGRAGPRRRRAGGGFGR